MTKSPEQTRFITDRFGSQVSPLIRPWELLSETRSSVTQGFVVGAVLLVIRLLEVHTTSVVPERDIHAPVSFDVGAAHTLTPFPFSVVLKAEPASIAWYFRYPISTRSFSAPHISSSRTPIRCKIQLLSIGPSKALSAFLTILKAIDVNSVITVLVPCVPLRPGATPPVKPLKIKEYHSFDDEVVELLFVRPPWLVACQMPAGAALKPRIWEAVRRRPRFHLHKTPRAALSRCYRLSQANPEHL